MSWRWIAAVVAVAVAADPAAATLEDTPLPIPAVVDLASVSAYGPVAAPSPDGARIAFVVMNRESRQIRLVSLEDSSSRALTEPQDDAWAPAWSPDGGSLAFFMRRAGEHGLWIWRGASGELVRLSQSSVAGNPPWLRPVWTPDGRSVIVVLAAATGPSVDVPHAPPPVEDIRVFRAHRPGNATRLPSERPMTSGGLALVDARSGAVRQIFSGQVSSFHLSPRGTELAVLERLPRPNPNTFELLNRLQVVSLSGGKPKVLSDTVTTVYGRITWSPDGRYLGWVQDYAPEIGPAYLASVADGRVRKVRAEVSFASNAYAGRPPLWDARSRRFFLVAEGQLWVGEVPQGGARRLTSLQDWRIAELVPGLLPGTAFGDGDALTAVVKNSTTLQEGFARIDLRTGALSLLAAGDAHYVDGINQAVVLDRGTKILYTSQSASEPEALWLAGADFRSSSRVAPVNAGLEGRIYGRARLLQWKNSRGDSLQGALLMPAAMQPGRRYPLVLDVYAEEGAAQSLNTFGLDPEGKGQLFATRGYAVLRPGTRLRVGTPVADLIDDILPGLDAAIATGMIDPGRIVVMGHSYGGYNTLALISGTDRFRAAVSAAGFADLISGVYGNEGKGTMSPGWAEGGQGRMGDSPWAVRERYLENSPLWRLDKVHTPLLLLHGTDDDTVPVFASTMVFNALQRLGREVEYVQYVGEGHAILQHRHRVDYFERILAWFDEHLGLARDPQGRLLLAGDRPLQRTAPLAWVR